MTEMKIVKWKKAMTMKKASKVKKPWNLYKFEISQQHLLITKNMDLESNQKVQAEVDLGNLI